jgi:serine/threonine protein kinase
MKIIGKYQGAEEIGRSAAGVTCRARDPFRNRDYVLKVLSPLAALSAASKDRLYRDLAVSWDLTHRHIAKLQDIGELEGIVYIATELLEGCSLVDFLAAAAGSLPEKLTLMAQVCEALACAHSRGIAHGNVKPNNIFITDTRNAAVLDFGTGTWQALLLASGVRLNGPTFSRRVWSCTNFWRASIPFRPPRA